MSTEKHINIVSFDVPFPANYGGVIDVYYKIKYLKENSVKVHLHCFEYGREQSEELETLCETVDYYPRKTGFLSHLSTLPYIVKSRTSEAMVKKLLKNDYPILFEGMHTLGIGLDKRLSNRKLIYRESNIEHHYYYHLYKAEKSIFKRFYYQLESWKLKYFEKNILKFDRTLVVSKADYEELKGRYSNLIIDYLASFHPDHAVSTKLGRGEYALYIGNLSVAENVNAVEYLIIEVFSQIDYPFVVAGLNPSKELKALVDKYENISLKANLLDAEMKDLVQNAQFNVLVTFQATGLKLKLLNTLYQGRFVIVNQQMVTGTGLSNLCELANSSEEIINKIHELRSVDYTESLIKLKEKQLAENYSNQANIESLIQLM